MAIPENNLIANLSKIVSALQAGNITKEDAKILISQEIDAYTPTAYAAPIAASGKTVFASNGQFYRSVNGGFVRTSQFSGSYAVPCKTCNK